MIDKYKEFKEKAEQLAKALAIEKAKLKKNYADIEDKNRIDEKDTKNASKYQNLHANNKKEDKSTSMQSYGNYEATMLSFLEYLARLNKERSKAPRYDTTRWLIKSGHKIANLANYGVEALAVFMNMGDKMGLEYAIEIVDGRPEAMVTSEGNKVSHHESQFSELIALALKEEGYTIDSSNGPNNGKYVDQAGTVLTQEAFDKGASKELRKNLSAYLVVGDLNPAPGLRP